MRSRSGSSRWEAGRIVSCCSFGGFQTIEFGLYVPALAREFLQAPQEGLFGLFRCCHLPTCENHNIGEAEPQHTAIGLAGFSAEYASLPPLRFKVGVSSRDRIFLFNGSKRLKVQAKTCISEWRGVRIVPTFPRVAETTVLMVRISFAPPLIPRNRRIVFISPRCRQTARTTGLFRAPNHQLSRREPERAEELARLGPEFSIGRFSSSLRGMQPSSRDANHHAPVRTRGSLIFERDRNFSESKGLN
jgi:hypothetical protein